MLEDLIGEETAILLTDSASLATGLHALLLAIPPIQRVECLVDAAALLERLESFHPSLVVIDTSLVRPTTAAVLDAIQALIPHTHRVVFTDDMAELRRLANRQSETVIVKGADAGWLADVFESILNAPVTSP